MRLSFEKDRVIVVVAHPDDAELLCAGTLGRARDDGADIAICVMCKGEKGQPAEEVKDLAAVRRKEMSAAARLLGAKLFRGEYGDGYLEDGRSQRLKLTEIFRQFKPTLVLAHSPDDYHADHRASSAIAEAASWLCAARGHKTASPATDSAPSVWWMDTVEMLGFEPGFYVDVSPYTQLKEEMLACHLSQMARGKDADFSPLLDLLRRQSQTRGAQCGVAAAEAFRAHQAFKRVRAW